MRLKTKQKISKPVSKKTSPKLAKKEGRKKPKAVRPIDAPKTKKPLRSEKKETQGEEPNKKRFIKKTVTDPKKDPAFQKTLQDINTKSEAQKEHPEPETKQTEMQDASKVSVEEQQKENDQQAHYQSIEGSSKVDETKKFSAESFKEALKGELDKLERKLPHDSDSADDFKKEKPLEQLKDDVNSKVVDGQEKATGTLQKDVASDNPPQSDITPVEPVPIPTDDPGSAPGSINGVGASPKPKHSSEISMEEESAKLDDLMSENSVTETQLANSNEPTFVEALGSKTQAQQAAARAPSRYRAKERAILAGANEQAVSSGTAGVGAMFTSRIGSFQAALDKQTTTKDAVIEKKQALAKKFETIYTTTKEKVTKKLDGLTTFIEGFFEEGGAVYAAQKRFERNVEEELDDIYGWTTLDDKLFGEDTEAIEKVFRVEKRKFITSLNKIFDRIAEHIATGLNQAMTIIGDGRAESKKLYDGLSKEDKKLAKESYDTFNDRYNDLEDTVKEKEQELAQSLASQYKKSVDSLRESFDAIKKRVSAGWIDKAIDAVKGVIDTIKKLGELIRTLISEIADFIPQILDDPIGFVKLLFGGVKDGIELFKSNIKKHLLGGFIKWLTGAMGPMGITIPENLFSLKGIFSLVMQILGLGWEFIRKKAVKLFGEPAVKVMETGFEMFKIFRKDGIKGIWTHLKEKFHDLKETVIGEIKTMLITQVVMAGAKWLAGLLVPGGAFIKAIIAIKDLIVVIVDTAMRIIPVLIEAIRALASGNVKGIAKAVENGLAALVVVVINIFAKILGIGGLAKKVQKIVKKVRKRIDRAVDKLLNKAKKAFKKLFGRGKKGKGTQKEKPVNKKIDKRLGEELSFKAGKESHKLWISNKGGRVTTMVASKNPGPIAKRLQIWETKLKTISNNTDRGKAQTYIEQAKKLNEDTLIEAKQERILTTAITKDTMITKEEYRKLEKSEYETIHKQVELKKYLLLLFDIFGYDIDDAFTIFKSQVIMRHCFKEIEQIINKNRKSMNYHNQWSSFAAELKTFHLFTEMLKSGSEFYNYMQNGMEDNSLEILLAGRSESKFILNSDKRAKINEYLDNYMSDDVLFAKGRDDIIAYIKTLVSGGTKRHTEFKPNSTVERIFIKNRRLIIEYKYENSKHQNRRFFSMFNFSNLNTNKREVKQYTSGKNLLLKEASEVEGRGHTDHTKNFLSEEKKEKLQREIRRADTILVKAEADIAAANKILNQSNIQSAIRNKAESDQKKAEVKKIRAQNIKINSRAIDYNNFIYSNTTAEKVQESVIGYKKHEHLFESAHILADEFLGSGYKEALNLLVTSQEYNRKTMAGAEKEVKKEVKDNQPSGLFNLTVSARWDVLEDSEILKKATTDTILNQLKNDAERDENNKILAADFAKKLQTTILSKDDPKRVLGVEYMGKLNAIKKNLTKREIGCDIWMSSYFNFDNSSNKCKY
jgi:hypothetical protein